MRFSSATERGELVSSPKSRDVTGLHKRSLSLAGQSGRKGDGAGVRLGGKRPVASELAVWVWEPLCPKRLRSKLVPLRGGLRFVEVSGNVVEVFIFPPVPGFFPCGWIGIG